EQRNLAERLHCKNSRARRERRGWCPDDARPRAGEGSQGGQRGRLIHRWRLGLKYIASLSAASVVQFRCYFQLQYYTAFASPV
ncbi:hypothetical protein B0H14DRAFT_3890557, partial [Mycena olivaceomarginata]